MEKELEYLDILKTIDILPFSVGKKLLIAVLRGDSHESIGRNKLDKLATYGSFHLYESDEVGGEIESLVSNRLIEYTDVNGKKFWKVLALTAKGRKELINPTLHKKRVRGRNIEKETIISDEEQKVFQSMDFYLNHYNDYQKKAIISDKTHILCIAGAGTGKTTVLTKRAEFLVKFRSIQPKKILAITFTRKARQEMQGRLKDTPGVMIETFNSFCEKYLNYYGDLVYGRPVRVIKFGEKIALLNHAIESLGKTSDQALDIYFTENQIRTKTKDQLSFILLNDCFTILDLFKFEKNDIASFKCECTASERAGVELVKQICVYMDQAMKKKGLRDYADQLLDCYRFFSANEEYIPKFDHILVDEYQDVNSMQIRLLELLSSGNLFAVGDPRQSIFGWRGSKIHYILDFGDRYSGAETIALVKNYRSNKHIVDLINKSIRHMGLPDLTSDIDGKRKIVIKGCENEAAEQELIIEKIDGYEPNEVFVLARTNRQLNDLSAKLKTAGISHVVKNDEQRRPKAAGPDDITLATIHSIKGLEAKLVILMGVTPNNFPCKSSDHPVIDLIITDDYDKEEEERRLFYVALSRAREEILMTYVGKTHTWFINKGMSSLIDSVETKMAARAISSTGDMFTDLKAWRSGLARQLGIPAYLILHDSTIQEITDTMPISTMDLTAVKGLGPEKVRKYGADILAIVNK